MNHQRIKTIYEDIRREPYMVPEDKDSKAPCCYIKGLRLIGELAKHGYSCRGRLAELDWRDTPIPDDIKALVPSNVKDYSFFVEVLIDGQYRVLDPSIDPETAKLGFRMVNFEGDERTCFDFKKLFPLEEQKSLLSSIQGEDHENFYYDNMRPFLRSFSQWLKDERGKLHKKQETGNELNNPQKIQEKQQDERRAQ